MRYGIVPAVLGALLLSAVAGWGQGAETSVKVVVVQGVGASRADAIADGEKQAVSQCLSLYCKSEVLTANAEVIRQNVYVQVNQYVQSNPAVTEEKTADGQCAVKLSVPVNLEKLGVTLDTLWEKLKVAGNPRIILTISQLAPAETTDDLTQNEVTDKLVGLGFKVLDEGQLKQTRQKEALKLLRDGHTDAVSIQTLQDVADVVIVGKAAAREQEVDVAGAHSCQATLDAKAIRTDTAQVLAAARGKATKAGFSTNEAAEKSLEVASADWVAKNLPALVRAVVDPCKEYTLLVTGCEQQDIIALDDKLTADPKVRQTDQVAFDKGLAQLAVQYQGSIMAFAKDLAALPNIVVESTTANTIRVHLKKANR